MRVRSNRSLLGDLTIIAHVENWIRINLVLTIGFYFQILEPLLLKACSFVLDSADYIQQVKYPQISSSLFCLVLLIILATIIIFLFSLTFWLVAGKMEMKSKFVY